MTATSSEGSTGFGRCQLKPASSARRRSSGRECAVTAIATGRCALAPLERGRPAPSARSRPRAASRCPTAARPAPTTAGSQARPRGAGDPDFGARVLDDRGEQLARLRLVVHDQHAKLVEPARLAHARRVASARSARAAASARRSRAAIVSGMQHAERRPGSGAGALHRHRAAVQLDEVAHDRQARARGRRAAASCPRRPDGSDRTRAAGTRRRCRCRCR